MTTDFLIMKVVYGLTAVNFGVLAVIVFRWSVDGPGYAIAGFCASVAVGAAAVAILARQKDGRS